jgi:hypothetical protein
MTISELAGRLGFEALSLPSPGAEVTGGYTGDLLSWVMGRARAGQVWITIMTNINIVAVAMLAGVSAIVIADDSPVSDEVVKKAGEEGINLLRSRDSAFSISVAVGRELGI